MISKKKNQYFLIAILVIFGVYCSLNIGKAWDTFFFIQIGKERLAYLLSFGLNTSSESITTIKYPAIYNTLNAFFLQLFPKNFELQVFHIINFIISFLGALGVYRLTKYLFNKDTAKYTFAIFLLYPIFFGHMSINDRDPITIFCNIWIIYYSLKYLQFNVKKNKNYIIYISLLLTLGLGIRFAFIVTLFPLLFYLFFLILKKKDIINFKNLFLDIVKIILMTIFFLLLFWTPTHKNLLVEPLRLINDSFSHPWGYPFVFLNGEVFNSNLVPKFYILKNLFFKSPEYIIFLYLFFTLFISKIVRLNIKIIKNFNSKIFFVLINMLFPTILLFFSPYSVYDGLRLFLFILPFFCIIPAITLNFLVLNSKNLIHRSSIFITTILIFYYLFNFIIITPYHYTYLNIFTGKYSNVSKKFENDYWGTSLKELSKKIGLNKNINNNLRSTFSICGVSKGTIKYYFQRIDNFKYKIVRDNEKPDYIIMTNRVLADYDKKNPMQKTCFDKYKGETIESVNRRGLELSVIRKLN